MGKDIVTFEKFVRSLLGEVDVVPGTPLSQLPVGDYAMLAWLDDMQTRSSANIEADIVAQWDTVSLRDVYAMLVGDSDNIGVGSS